MEMLLGIISFNKKLYYRQTKSTKDPEKLPRQMFLAEKRKKTKNKKRKTDLLKKLKKKKTYKKRKKDGFLQKHRIEEPRYESPTKTIKYK